MGTQITYPDANGAGQTVSEATPMPVRMAGGNAGAGYTKGATSVQAGSIALVNGTALDTFDALDFQSITVQIAGTFVGTAVFQVSNDGVNWTNKVLTSAAGTPVASTTTPGVFFGDIGARYFRVIASPFTSGTIIVAAVFDALSTAPPTQSLQNVQGTVTANPNNVTAAALLTAVNLAAGATYTGTTIDGGASVPAQATRTRPMVMATSGVVPGHLVLQESTDGTNWRETRRSPVPSDGQYHTFDWPVHMRYYRLLYINGTVAQTAFALAYLSARGEGSTIDVASVMTFPETVAVGGAIAANTNLTGTILDLGSNHNISLARALAVGDQAGAAVRIEWSVDGVNFFLDTASVVQMTSAQQIYVSESKVCARYLRTRIANGATAQTAARLFTTLVSA